MSYLILDLSIAAAAKGINKQLIEQNGIMPRDFVFKKHKIDSTTFAQNNAYYSYNLKDFEAIYKKVNDSLLVLKAIAQKNSYIKIDKVKLDKQKAKTELKAKLPEFDK